MALPHIDPSATQVNSALVGFASPAEGASSAKRTEERSLDIHGRNPTGSNSHKEIPTHRVYMLICSELDNSETPLIFPQIAESHRGSNF